MTGLGKYIGRTLCTVLLLGILLPGSALAASDRPIIWGYQEGLAKAQSSDGKFGYANTRGEIVIPMQYTSVLDFSLGLGQVQLGNKLGVIRQDGVYLLQPEYDSLLHINAGLYIAQKGVKWGVVSLLPFPNGNGGSTQIFYDFIYESVALTQIGGVDTLVLTDGTNRTALPLYQITQLMLQRNVPSARFPLDRGSLPSFSDVTHRDWYDLWVDLAFNLGLMEGVGGNRFGPQQTLTVAEALRLAACMESRQTGDNFHTQPITDSVWYRPSVNYCVASGIIKSSDFSNYLRPITRTEMARIFAATELGLSIPTINSLSRVKASVPDVKPTDFGADAIYSLYAKGILAGTSGKYTFNPNATLTRAEAAGIVSRMARTEQRLNLF